MRLSENHKAVIHAIDKKGAGAGRCLLDTQEKKLRNITPRLDRSRFFICLDTTNNPHL